MLSFLLACLHGTNDRPSSLRCRCVGRFARQSSITEWRAMSEEYMQEEVREGTEERRREETPRE